MDVLKFLQEGNKTKNPEYNPKTKKGRLEPPFLVNNKPGDSVSDRLRLGIADNAAKYTYALDTDQIDKYADYNTYLNPFDSEADLNRERAEHQSALEQASRSLIQMVGNEVVLGTALGFSNIVDMAANLGKEKGEDDYTNPVSQFLEGLQDDLRERFEIYQKDPNATWAVGDFGWWANNAVSVASSASMLLPSMTITKTLGALSKLGRAGSRVSLGIVRAAKGAHLTSKPYTFARSIGTGAEIGTTAALSRTMENYLEARGVYKEVYEDTLNRISTMNEEDKQELIKNNPQFEGKSNEDIAKYISSVSADKTFQNDYAMLLFDIPQFKAISSLWKGVSRNGVRSAARIANRNSIRSLLNTGEEGIEKINFLSKTKESLKQALYNPLTSITAIEWSEGVEEGYQGIQTEKGKEVAKRILDPTMSSRSVESYLTDPAIWEQAFWGVIGGVGFQAIGNFVGNQYNKIKGKINEKRLSERDFALSQMTDEKIALDEINNRKARLTAYTEAMQLLSQGKNPLGYKTDPVTKLPIMEDGVKQREDITKEEAEDLKMQLTNQLVTEMALDATDSGTYDLFKEFVSSKEFDKFFEQAGINETVEDKKLSQRLIEQMDNVHENYNNAIYDIYNSLDVQNQSVAQAEARSIARRKLQIDSYEDAINRLDKHIEILSDNGHIDDAYLERERVNYIKKQLEELDAQEKDLKIRVANKTLSPQAYEEYKKSYDERRQGLLAYAANNTTAGAIENIKTELAKEADKANVDKMIAEFNDFVAAHPEFTGTTDSKATPKKTIQKAIKQKIELEDSRDFLRNSLPVTQQQYQKEYNELNKDIDKAARQKFQDAAEKVSSWIEKQEDLNKAVEDVISNNVPELQEELDLLKVGHYNTRNYTEFINQVIKRETADRKKKEEKAKQVHVDGEEESEERAAKTKEEIEDSAKRVDSRDDSVESPSTGERPAKPTKPAKPAETVSSPTPSPDSTAAPAPTVDPNIVPPIPIEKAALQADEKLEKDKGREELSLDERSSGIAVKVIGELSRTQQELITNILGKDTTSKEYNDFIDTVAGILEEKGVSRGISRSAAIKASRVAFKGMSRRLKERGENEKSDKFIKLANEVATKLKSGELYAATSIIEDSDFYNAIDDFIEAFIDYKNVVKGKKKTTINLENLFNELITNTDIGIDEARFIFYNMKDYINKINTKYKFTNKRYFNANLKNPDGFFRRIIENRTIETPLDSYMHISVSNNRTASFFEDINNIENGAELTAEYGLRKNGEKSNRTISIKYKGREIGYIATVDALPDNTGFKLRKINRGFVYEVRKDENGNITSNLDEFFTNLINQTNEDYEEIWDLVNKKHLEEEAIKDGELGEELTNEEIEKILNNKVIIDLINSGKYIISSDATGIQTNREKVNRLLHYIDNIIGYDTEAMSRSEIFKSYSNWVENVYNNYKNTHEIESAIINSNKDVSIKIAGLKNRRSIITNEERNANEIGLTYDTNPILVAVKEGDKVYFVNEKTGKQYNSRLETIPGTGGFLIQDNPNAPIIASITSSNKLSTNSQLANDVYKELTNLFTKFQNGEITYDEIVDSLTDLFSGPGAHTNNLFSGYSIIKSDKVSAINIDGVKGQYCVYIYKNKPDSEETGTGITYMENGDETKAITTIKPNDNLIKKMAKEIVSNLTYNLTYYTIRDGNKDNDNSNKYIYKKNGKLIVSIGGRTTEYNNFSHFALANNAFKTNQGTNSRGGFFDLNEKANSIYIDVSTLSSPVEGMNPIERTITLNNKKTPGYTKDILRLAKIPEEQINILTGDNVFGIKIIEDKYYFDAKLTGANAKYNKGKLYFSPIGAKLSNNTNDLKRLLIHESLHAKFDQQNLFARENLIEDLLATYDAFIEALNNDNSSEANLIKKWIKENGFTPKEYFDRLPAKRKKELKKADQKQLNRIFAEEWLVESLSQGMIMNYLNIKEWKGEEVLIEDMEDSKKTIWQKIIELLLKLFGKDTSNVKNNTILARQYLILGNNVETTNADAAKASETNKSIDKPGETPITANEPIETTKEETTRKTVVEESIEDDTTKEQPAETKKETNIELGVENTEHSAIEEDEDFAITTSVETSDEVKLDTFNENKELNPNGLSNINNMNDYLNQFPSQDKPMIAQMLNEGRIKFVCR